MTTHLVEVERLINYDDPRVRASIETDGRMFDSEAMTLTFTTEDEDGEEIDITLPAKYEVCGLCNGKATHVDPAIDENGITSEDFADDPDFRESYFAGHYDVTCYECSGRRVVPEVDNSTLTATQAIGYTAYLAWRDAEADFAAVSRAERRMGA